MERRKRMKAAKVGQTKKRRPMKPLEDLQKSSLKPSEDPLTSSTKETTLTMRQETIWMVRWTGRKMEQINQSMRLQGIRSVSTVLRIVRDNCQIAVGIQSHNVLNYFHYRDISLESLKLD
jgi:hypothetical protein